MHHELTSEYIHLKMSPGTSLNCTRISAFLEFNALPALRMKGTPVGYEYLGVNTKTEDTIIQNKGISSQRRNAG